MAIVCPIENKDDSVQSVPALVTGGTSRGSFSGPSGGVTYIDGKYGYTSGTTRLYGSLTSDIAHSLAAPLPPKEISFWSIFGWSVLFLFSICIIIGPFLVWPSFKNSIAKNPKDQEIIFTPGVSFGCVIYLILGWHPITWLFYPSLKNTLVGKIDYPRRYKLWKEALSKWEKLYYCHRCGVVFNPQTNEHFTPNQLNDNLRIFEFEL